MNHHLFRYSLPTSAHQYDLVVLRCDANSLPVYWCVSDRIGSNRAALDWIELDRITLDSDWMERKKVVF